jgi:AbiJ N-terminal domain 4
MLTDIFAHRYKQNELWKTFTDSERRLLVQAFRIFSEQVCPFTSDGKDTGLALWSALQSRLSMELGLASLSPLTYNFMGQWNGKPHHYYGTWTILQVCETWFSQEFDGSMSADFFIKERLSLIELGFRMREAEIQVANASLPAAIKAADTRDLARIQLPVFGNYSDFVKEQNSTTNKNYRDAVDELNVRFRQADCKLNYHNGFIQLAQDSTVAEQIETPFWNLVSDPKWKNVDTDMKEAFDRRDTGGRDPALYAVRALESTIKIVSGEKGWTHGKENGAHNFIDNLASKSAGFLTDWQAKALKHLFTSVRNPLGHGPGAAAMPVLTKEQTDLVIETCLSWIKSIIRRC